jgi:hypothetical protein
MKTFKQLKQNISEEVQQIDEISSNLALKVSSARLKRVFNDPQNQSVHDKFKRASNSAMKRIDRDMAKDPERTNRGYASDADNNTKRGWSNESVEIDEGIQQTLRKYVPGYAKKQIDKKMDDGKFGRTDVDKDANFYRYKKIQDKLKNKEVVAEGGFVSGLEKIDRASDTVGYKKFQHALSADPAEKRKLARTVNRYNKVLNKPKNALFRPSNVMGNSDLPVDESGVAEEVEQLDELSKKTLGSYIKSASHDVAAKGAATRQFAIDSTRKTAEQDYSGARKSMEMSDKTFSKSWKRRNNMAKAVDRLTREESDPSIQNQTDAGRTLVHKQNKEPMPKLKTKTPLTESRKAEIVKELYKKKKNEIDLKKGEKFQPEPVLTSQIVKEDK